MQKVCKINLVSMGSDGIDSDCDRIIDDACKNGTCFEGNLLTNGDL